jgi:LuxR family maltose regulon positive regulatory protein
MLEANYASNLMVVPLDREQVWYRYHYLFREMLRHELDRLEPEAAPSLAMRASMWCEENDLIDEAIHYAQLARSSELVGSILLRHGLPLYMKGRMTALQGWFGWLADAGLTDGAVAVLASHLFLESGKAATAEQWARVAEAAPQELVLADGSPLEAWVLTLRARTALDARSMQVNAERALELLAPRSPFHPAAVGLLGIAHMMQGHLDEADGRFADAVELSIQTQGAGIASSALAFRAMVAVRDDRWDAVPPLVEQAMSFARKAHLQDYPLTALVHSVRARLAVHQGDARTAAEAIAAAEDRLEQLTNAFIARSIEVRIELAHAYLGLGEARSAEDLLHEVRGLLDPTTGFDFARIEMEELSAKVEAMRGSLPDSIHLTPAELRLFPLLATQLSFREIAESLFLSIHTVKAEVTSIYRKLGVSSRTKAIERAREIGLLPPMD